MEDKNQKILAAAPYRTLLLRLCLPSIVVMLVLVVYNMADTFFIGKMGSASKIAAVSLCSPLFSGLSGIGTLFGNGGCTSISLALGKGDRSRMKAISSFCFLSAMAVSLVFAVCVLLFLEPICLALGADADTLSDACAYLRIIAIGAPVILFSNVFASIVRADGDAVVSMYSNAVGTVSNILLDALFILEFSWGVAGAAWATVLGNLLSSIFLLGYILWKKPDFSMHPKYLQWKKDIVVPVFSLGLPMASSTLLMSLSHILANRLMMGHGAVALAAQGIAGKIGMLISMLMMGICMGLQPVISYSFSAKNYDRMYSVLGRTAVFTACLGSVMAVGGFIARDTLIGIFLDDPSVLEFGRVMVVASLITGPFYGLYQLCTNFLQSTGKASYAIIVAVLDKGLIYIPCLYLLNFVFGAYGIAFTSAATLMLSLTVSAALSKKWSRTIRQTISTREVSL